MRFSSMRCALQCEAIVTQRSHEPNPMGKYTLQVFIGRTLWTDRLGRAWGGPTASSLERFATLQLWNGSVAHPYLAPPASVA